MIRIPKLLVWACLFISSAKLFAQAPYSPFGGNLKLWLRADKAVTFNEGNGAVTAWADPVNPGVGVAQNTVSAQPRWLKSALNGMPAIEFLERKSQFLEGLLPSAQYLVTPNTVFMVSRVDETTTGGFQYGTMGISGNYWLRGSTCKGVFTNAPIGQAALFTGIYHSSDCVYSSAFLNGLALPSNAQGCPVSPGERIVVGTTGKAGKNNNPFQGLVCEILVFNEALGNARRTIIENYLAAKYGLTINNDRYTGHEPGFRYHVNGVGMEGKTGQFGGESNGMYVFAPEGYSLNSNGDYVLLGHNAPEDDWQKADQNAWISDTTANCSQRLQREWYLDKTGTLGNGTQLFFIRGGRLNVSGESLVGTQFVLLYKKSPKEPYKTVAATCKDGDAGFYFTLTDAQLLDGYYTLGKP